MGSFVWCRAWTATTTVFHLLRARKLLVSWLFVEFAVAIGCLEFKTGFPSTKHPLLFLNKAYWHVCSRFHVWSKQEQHQFDPWNTFQVASCHHQSTAENLHILPDKLHQPGGSHSPASLVLACQKPSPELLLFVLLSSSLPFGIAFLRVHFYLIVTEYFICTPVVLQWALISVYHTRAFLWSDRHFWHSFHSQNVR